MLSSDQVYLVKAVPVKDDRGRILAGMLVTQDITDLKQAELQASAEKDQLSVTLHSIGDGVITTDLTGKVTLINRVAENLTGWSQAEAVGQPIELIFKIVDEKTGLPAANPIYQTLLEDQTIFLTDRILLQNRKGGERSIADSSAPIRDNNGTLQGVVLVFQDVTEQHRLTEELLKSSKLESLGVLAGGIAHDFNNLLSVIVGNLGLTKLTAQAQPQSSLSSVLEYAEEAEVAALRSRDITGQLLTFARGGSPVKKSAQLGQLIREVGGFTLHGANVQCTFNLDPHLWLVEMDSGQIGQVIQNLVLNAVQAMPEGGQLEIKASNLTLNSNEKAGLNPGNYIQLIVSDTGSGIEPAYLSRIFDPYFTTKSKGNGLGLAVCYSIIKQHGGLISVESQPGVGTSFYVYLPATSQPLEISVPPKAEPVVGRGRILIMDDEPKLQEVTRRLITQWGYSVDAAGDGQTALNLYEAALIEKRPFNLVLLDLTVPGGMGGKKTMERLREIDPDVVAIVCSGYSSDPILANYADYGFAGVLVKPYRLAELSKIVQRLVNQSG